MNSRSLLMKLSFLLGGLSIVYVGAVLKQGLTAFIVTFVFLIIAGILSKSKDVNHRKNI
ncbi:hypothetical protein [Metabacillus iocasae]|uniref:Uncharacterized protein n=1 Tax=Priestia iocasae TaxID=2291674 RepID=A0ABS2QU97_9BACI|nr:hypothetical protein [Metabacillus iocasae]MBM7702301.1 hypothetical protein [Metabacillus iocasae]